MRDFLDIKFDDFVESFNLDKNTKDDNEKRFINFHFFSQFQPGRLDTDEELLEQICIGSESFSEIHGAFFLLNDQILHGVHDIDDVLDRDQKGLFDLYFLSVGDADKFAEQLVELFDKLDSYDTDEEWLNILSYIVSQKIIRKWKGNPALHLILYGENCERKIEFSEDFTDFFSSIDTIEINKRRLQEIINSNENSFQAEIEAKAQLLISGSDEKFGEAYVMCLEAKELVELLMTPEGLLRHNLFDDNVRDSQGDTSVNQEILSTLKNHPDRFILYNNGITIVCKSVKPKYGKYILENPQIVNGCQTCNAIFKAHKEGISIDKVQIVAKIVGSNKEDLTQGIVRGANRQNIVYEEAFETIKYFHKKLEQYFENNQISGYDKIYYERRSRQYTNQMQIKPQQKISFRGLIQSMVALFLNHVEESHRHEYTLLKKYRDDLFIDNQSLLPYYLAAFLNLNIDILFRDGTLPKYLSGYKMHILLLVKEMQGGESPGLFSEDMTRYCERIILRIKDGELKKAAIDACSRFEDIRDKWINIKGEQYKHGIKDSAEFRVFLMKEIHGEFDDHEIEKTYVGYVLNVNLDKYNTWYGFIEHKPNNIFFHEFDNPDMDRSFVGKKVTFKIVNDGNKERAINVQILDE